MIRILIVEDEMPIADLLDMSLTAAGYSCDCLDNGAAAADAVESRRYDLILLDVMLPVHKDDDVRDFPKILFNLHHQALLNAYHSVDIRVVQRVADVLYRADYVYVLGPSSRLSLPRIFCARPPS